MRRNGLDAAMFEILQVLKFAMRRNRLEFSASWRPPTEEELINTLPAEAETATATQDSNEDADEELWETSAVQLLGELRIDELLALAAQYE